jgi:hypothetical protein
MAVADAITIIEDMGNRIPDRSWMLYLLEVFDRKAGAPAELNLICQFNDRDNFWAIFAGVNRYKFTQVLPAVGHTYQRQIIFQKQSQAIQYVLTDRTAGKSEKFVFNATGIAFEGKSHFTGVEWWNKVASHTFPVRYRVDISELMCGIADGQGITYMPYDGFVPNRDGSSSTYQVSFVNPAPNQGYLSYGITDGITSDGFGFVRGGRATL